MTANHEHARGGRTLAVIEVVSLLLLVAFLVFSAASGQLRFFLAPGFVWLPPAAAVLVLAMSAARFLALRAGGAACECGDGHSGSTTMRWLYAVVLVVPLVFGLAVNPRQFSPEGVRKRIAPPATRDAALERAMNWVLGLKQSPSKHSAAPSELPAEPTVAELARALESDGGRALAGKFVTVIGQCGADNATTGGRFELYRLVVTCCIADATAVSVEVAGLPTVTVEQGQWLRISGVIAVEGGASPQAMLRAATISKIPTPPNPYL
jgi:uncharacterized repeat protein (TIGR03943 family)